MLDQGIKRWQLASGQGSYVASSAGLPIQRIGLKHTQTVHNMSTINLMQGDPKGSKYISRTRKHEVTGHNSTVFMRSGREANWAEMPVVS